MILREQNALLHRLTDTELVALTLWGEIRNGTPADITAVASVIKNRRESGRWGPSFRTVCLWPSQFSCWAPIGGPLNERNYTLLLKQAASLRGPVDKLDPKLTELLHYAGALVMGDLPSTVGTSTHYMTKALFERKPPPWGRGRTPDFAVGPHVFFQNVY
jgi:hypothetical protein